MLHIIWMLSSVALIFFIIIHNPKAQTIGGQNQLFAITRTAEQKINKITWALIIIFFSLTIFLSAFQ